LDVVLNHCESIIEALELVPLVRSAAPRHVAPSRVLLPEAARKNSI
jgi:hypothetical protein